MNILSFSLILFVIFLICVSKFLQKYFRCLNLLIFLQIYVGLDVYADVKVWDKLQLTKKPTIYCRDLADFIWTPKKLVNRALNLETCRNLNINRFSPRKEIEKDKRALWEGAVIFF